jgi:hypothetical protein
MFIVRYNYPPSDGGYPLYLKVIPGFEEHINPKTLGPDPDIGQATQFPTRQKAEEIAAMMAGAHARASFAVVEV